MSSKCDSTLLGQPPTDSFYSSTAATKGSFQNMSVKNACVQSLYVDLVNGQPYTLPVASNRINSFIL